MIVKSLKIKNVSYYFWNDIIYLNKFDNNMFKINKRENRENIYYISYIINKPEYDINIVNNLCIAIQNLYCTIEKIDGSIDTYLVIDKNNKMNKKNIKLFNKLWAAIISKIKYSRNDAIFDDNVIKITDWNKFKFSSDLDMPIDTLINFNYLTIIFSHVVEKGNKFIPEIYVDQGIFEEV